MQTSSRSVAPALTIAVTTVSFTVSNAEDYMAEFSTGPHSLPSGTAFDVYRILPNSAASIGSQLRYSDGIRYAIVQCTDSDIGLKRR